MTRRLQNQGVNVTVHSVVTKKRRDEILDLVEGGKYLSLSDFIRQAIREKLERS